MFSLSKLELYFDKINMVEVEKIFTDFSGVESSTVTVPGFEKKYITPQWFYDQ